MEEYKYLGDRFTDPEFKGAECSAVRRNGKCIRGRNSNMLVSFSGKNVVVNARILRKIKQPPLPSSETAPEIARTNQQQL